MSNQLVLSCNSLNMSNEFQAKGLKDPITYEVSMRKMEEAKGISDRFTLKERVVRERESFGSFKIGSELLKKRVNPTDEYNQMLMNKEHERYVERMKAQQKEINYDDDTNLDIQDDNPANTNLINIIENKISNLKKESIDKLNKLNEENMKSGNRKRYKNLQYSDEIDEDKVQTNYLAAEDERMQVLKHVQTIQKPEYMTLEQLQKEKSLHERKIVELENEYYGRKMKKRSNSNYQNRMGMKNKHSVIQREGYTQDIPIDEYDKNFIYKYEDYLNKKYDYQNPENKNKKIDYEEEWNTTKINSQNANGLVNRTDGLPGILDIDDYQMYYYNIRDEDKKKNDFERPLLVHPHHGKENTYKKTFRNEFIEDPHNLTGGKGYMFTQRMYNDRNASSNNNFNYCCTEYNDKRTGHNNAVNPNYNNYFQSKLDKKSNNTIKIEPDVNNINNNANNYTISVDNENNVQNNNNKTFQKFNSVNPNQMNSNFTNNNNSIKKMNTTGNMTMLGKKSNLKLNNEETNKISEEIKEESNIDGKSDIHRSNSSYKDYHSKNKLEEMYNNNDSFSNNSQINYIKMIYKMLTKTSNGSAYKNRIISDMKLNNQTIKDLGFYSMADFKEKLNNYPTKNSKYINENEFVHFLLIKGDLSNPTNIENYNEDNTMYNKTQNNENNNYNEFPEDNQYIDDLPGMRTNTLDFLTKKSTKDRLHELKKSLSKSPKRKNNLNYSTGFLTNKNGFNFSLYNSTNPNPNFGNNTTISNYTNKNFNNTYNSINNHNINNSTNTFKQASNDNIYNQTFNSANNLVNNINSLIAQSVQLDDMANYKGDDSNNPNRLRTSAEKNTRKKKDNLQINTNSDYDNNANNNKIYNNENSNIQNFNNLSTTIPNNTNQNFPENMTFTIQNNEAANNQNNNYMSNVSMTVPNNNNQPLYTETNPDNFESLNRNKSNYFYNTALAQYERNNEEYVNPEIKRAQSYKEIKLKSSLNFTIPKPFEFLKKDYHGKKLEKIKEILEERMKLETEVFNHQFHPNKYNKSMFNTGANLENVIEREKKERLKRTNALKEEIVLNMKPFSFYDEDERKYKKRIHQVYQAPQFPKFKANPIKWKSQVNMYDEMQSNEDKLRKERIKARAQETFNAASLPPRMEMYEKSKKLQDQEKKLIEEQERNEQLKNMKKFKAKEVPDFPKLQENFLNTLEKKKKAAKLTELKPFKFHEPKKKAEDYHYLDIENDPKTKNPQNKNDIQKIIKKMQRKPTIEPATTKGFAMFTEKRRKEIEEKKKEEEKIQEEENMRKQKALNFKKKVQNSNDNKNEKEKQRKKQEQQQAFKETLKKQNEKAMERKKEMEQRINNRPLMYKTIGKKPNKIEMGKDFEDEINQILEEAKKKDMEERIASKNKNAESTVVAAVDEKEDDKDVDKEEYNSHNNKISDSVLPKDEEYTFTNNQIYTSQITKEFKSSELQNKQQVTSSEMQNYENYNATASKINES